MRLKDEREKQRRRWEEAEKAETAQETVNLKSAYDDIVAAQKELKKVAKKPGDYPDHVVVASYGKAVQGLDALMDIEQYAQENSIPLDFDIKLTLERQQEYVGILKKVSNGRNRSTSRQGGQQR